MSRRTSLPEALTPTTAEASVLGGVLVRPDVLGQLDELEVEHFCDFRHKVVFAAMRSLADAHTPIDQTTLEQEVARAGKLEAIGGVAFFGELAINVPTPDNVVHYAKDVRLAWRNRQALLALDKARESVVAGFYPAAEVLEETVAELARFAERAPAPDTKRSRVWRRCRDDIDEITARADEPLVTLCLGDHSLVDLRAGAIALLIGSSGAGKTSLALSLLVDHALRHGPAIALSLELPSDELTARAIGLRRDAAWLDVLRGGLEAGEMMSALPERLVRIQRDDASLAALGQCIDDMRTEYPGEPVLCAVDYVQLVGADGEGEIRPRIGRVMRDLDRVMRERRAVCLALSQGSRASARGLSSGERIGAETSDAGAEAADLERWSTVTLAIGARGEPGEDGSSCTEISIGKSRMLGGDQVLPARYCGRSGLWRLNGKSRPAAEVRAERQSKRETKRLTSTTLAIAALAERSERPMSAAEFFAEVGGTKAVVLAAVRDLLRQGSLCRVRSSKRGGQWPVWTPTRAAAAGLEIVSTGGAGD